ncbi:MAG: nuclear pore complex subunit [Bacteroidetes bacterium RIFOXYA12_FULL_35_11]|nr:MAG: nuclear pore complex subunit [Bacteroidetes bacterium GWF2_35_48]OFY78381.1 MAG: nuclear pore complex subunit [Bacteroidetes bacterium RIFOXYA12_FULL_35_11]OFY92915.1 MAG: nuclear pore complex subunit [Bacteroidetes bacterium RIFOXYB2_FULL_35_7]HBX51585.1 nuclear pore complex subunit [Bacteroidales bacterium]
MESLLKKKTEKTPLVDFNIETGKFELSGRSIPEDSIGFYRPIFSWLDEYVKTPHVFTDVKINLEYFNTSSSKCLVDVFRKFEAIYKEGHKVQISWFYEIDNEDLLEIGEEYSSSLSVPFKMVPFRD